MIKGQGAQPRLNLASAVYGTCINWLFTTFECLSEQLHVTMGNWLMVCAGTQDWSELGGLCTCTNELKYTLF